MYFTYYSSSPFPKTSSLSTEYQPLLPTIQASNDLAPSSLKNINITSSTLRKLFTTVLLQTLTFLFLRYTTKYDVIGSVPAESLLLLLAIPSIAIPVFQRNTRSNFRTLTPQSTIRLLTLSLCLAISIYTALSSTSLIPASITLSVLSSTTFFVLLISSITLRFRNQSLIHSLLLSLLSLPCIAFVIVGAVSLPAFNDAFTAALFSSLSFAAFCLLIYNHIDPTVIYVATSAACGVLALVFADVIALQRVFSLNAICSATVLSVFIASIIDMAKLTPQWVAATFGISAPIVAFFSSFLFKEIPSFSGVVGLIAGTAVSIRLASLDGVKQGFLGGANLFLASSNKADRDISVRI